MVVVITVELHPQAEELAAVERVETKPLLVLMAPQIQAAAVVVAEQVVAPCRKAAMVDQAL